ncbi:cys-loop ligand-gated ion channel subunit 12344 precursor [Nasonia vitripennis]|uniref:Cys-loop ligand-gated ion channel subunit n=1 Tax=Nasonia vitripennis TaxID=7425 RepID=D3UAF5_NASVI|nr:cys-loop ligand-gated ion channel subunit 12344 precursor [Nasonia vitripennis]ACZ51426.1 cys-loop ligand-gated ion channel subunit [Nasonia vitripennis]
MRSARLLACVLYVSAVFSSSSYETHVENNYTAWPRMVLPQHYLKEIRPPTTGRTPVVVSFNIFVVDINSINVEDMDFRVDMFIYQTWTESRLRMPIDIFEDDEDYVTLPPEFFDNLWQPDPYFLNSKVSEIATLNSKHSSVTLYRNKTVRYSARMHAIIACQMEFQFYPMDIQICPMQIESFSYDSEKLSLRWGPDGVIVNPELKLLQYNLEDPLKIDESVSFIDEKNGNFSRLIVYFQFERQIGHHLIQTFAPSTLVVMLSWFSFWLGLDAIPGRVALLVTSMLTLVTMFTGLKSDIPPVAYVKALDLWMAGCMFFVFSALGEFVVVKVLDLDYQRECEASNSYRRLPARLSVVEKSVSVWDYDSVYTPKPRSKRAGSRNLLQNTWIDPEILIRRPKNRAKQIDAYSRVVFPVLFLVFTLLYWPSLLLDNRRTY